MDTQKLLRFKKIFPWYKGLAGDLLFWIAIDTLFLQFAKGFTLAEIVSINSIAHVLGIVLQFPIMKVVEKVGNTISVKVGVVLALVSALMYTFGQSFAVMVAATVLREMSASFKTIVNIILRHNLEILGEQDKYVDCSTRANTVYSVITMLIALVASFLFNLNYYIPMIACVSICFLCIFLSFYMTDFSEGSVVSDKKEKSRQKFKPSKLILIATLSFGIFFAVVSSGQSDAKLFIQDELLADFSEELTAVIVGLIIFISRVVRIFANVIFRNIYRKAKDKVGIIFALLLMLCFILLVSAHCIKGAVILKYSLMTVGYLIILFSRDPFQLYINDLVLKNSSPDEQPRIMMILEFSRKALAGLMSVSFAIAIMFKPMIFIMLMYTAIAAFGMFIAIYLYFVVKKGRSAPVK